MPRKIKEDTALSVPEVRIHAYEEGISGRNIYTAKAILNWKAAVGADENLGTAEAEAAFQDALEEALLGLAADILIKRGLGLSEIAKFHESLQRPQLSKSDAETLRRLENMLPGWRETIGSLESTFGRVDAKSPEAKIVKDTFLTFSHLTGDITDIVEELMKIVMERA